MSTTDEQTKYLTIYLRDHVAGATAGSQRAERLARSEEAADDALALARFAADVASDRDALLSLMATMGIEPSRLKAGAASVAEKVGAIKLNGRLVVRSPLSTIVELEAMQMAVRGKRSLWETLLVAMPISAQPQLEALLVRADNQLEVLEELHSTRIVATFAPRPV